MLLLLKTLIFQIDIIYIIYIFQKFLIVKNIAKKHIILLYKKFYTRKSEFFFGLFGALFTDLHGSV